MAVLNIEVYGRTYLPLVPLKVGPQLRLLRSVLSSVLLSATLGRPTLLLASSTFSAALICCSLLPVFATP